MVGLGRGGGAGEQAVRALFVEAGVALADAVSVVGSVLAPRRIAVTGSGLRGFDLMRPSFRAALERAFAPGLVPDRDVLIVAGGVERITAGMRSEEHTSELQSLMRNSYAVFCLKKKNKNTTN